MPTITLSHDDCTEWRAFCNESLLGLEQADPVVRANNSALEERLKRFRNSLEKAETVGTFNPAFALDLLTKIDQSGMETFGAGHSTPEEAAYVRRFRECKIVEAAAGRRTVIAELTEKGKILRAFLACWGGPG